MAAEQLFIRDCVILFGCLQSAYMQFLMSIDRDFDLMICITYSSINLVGIATGSVKIGKTCGPEILQLRKLTPVSKG